MTFDFFDQIESPCINNCTYDQSNSYCIGCFRTPNEIAKWFYMNKESRLKIMESIPSRKNLFKKIN